MRGIPNARCIRVIFWGVGGCGIRTDNFFKNESFSMQAKGDTNTKGMNNKEG